MNKSYTFKTLFDCLTKSNDLDSFLSEYPEVRQLVVYINDIKEFEGFSFTEFKRVMYSTFTQEFADELLKVSINGNQTKFKMYDDFMDKWYEYTIDVYIK